ncbi:MAG TPA: energy transducer TonB [Alphaproteobacteria bacterium]|jgi:TonB family protein|nr:energy transducer TonB [Alphaproteobacteria bacterium]
MPSNPWRCADFLERVRPGIAVSAAIHAGLFVLLAYLLAFHSPMPAPAEKDPDVISVVEPPRPPPVTPVNIKQPEQFRQLETKTIKTVTTTVGPYAFPPVDEANNGPPQSPPTTGPVQTVIVNPTPIYRGGLVYPERAADMGRSGYVDFDFIIEPDGTVGNPVVVEEVPDGVGFAAAAKKAFPSWKFTPMMKDGHPIAAPAHIRVTFKLS